MHCSGPQLRRWPTHPRRSGHRSAVGFSWSLASVDQAARPEFEGLHGMLAGCEPRKQLHGLEQSQRMLRGRCFFLAEFIEAPHSIEGAGLRFVLQAELQKSARREGQKLIDRGVQGVILQCQQGTCSSLARKHWIPHLVTDKPSTGSTMITAPSGCRTQISEWAHRTFSQGGSIPPCFCLFRPLLLRPFFRVSPSTTFRVCFFGPHR